MNKTNIFANAKLYVWKETFAIIKSKKTNMQAFANIVDKNEITCIVQEKYCNKEYMIAIEPGWKIVTFDMALPFGLVGFLAKISSALAKEKISIFVISSFSTDHILIKQDKLKKALLVLKELGFRIKNGTGRI